MSVSAPPIDAKCWTRPCEVFLCKCAPGKRMLDAEQIAAECKPPDTPNDPVDEVGQLGKPTTQSMRTAFVEVIHELAHRAFERMTTMDFALTNVKPPNLAMNDEQDKTVYKLAAWRVAQIWYGIDSEKEREFAAHCHYHLSNLAATSPGATDSLVIAMAHNLCVAADNAGGGNASMFAPVAQRNFLNAASPLLDDPLSVYCLLETCGTGAVYPHVSERLRNDAPFNLQLVTMAGDDVLARIDPALYNTPEMSRLVRTARLIHYNRNEDHKPWLRILATEPVFKVTSAVDDDFDYYFDLECQFKRSELRHDIRAAAVAARSSRTVERNASPPELALAVLRTPPDIPLEDHKEHRPSDFDPDKHHTWTREIYENSRKWRMEWASLVQLLEAARINVLIDAYLLVDAYPKTRTTRCIVRVMRWVLQDRLWTVCCCKAVEYRNEHGEEIVVDMSHEEATEAVMRMLEEVHLWNGPNSFFYTKYGWLKFTPFLLAAERQNFPLVKYLFLCCPDSTTVDSTSQAGNNAYALCKDYLAKVWGHPPSMIEDSDLLQFLAGTGISTDCKVDEYKAYIKNNSARRKKVRRGREDGPSAEAGGAEAGPPAKVLRSPARDVSDGAGGDGLGVDIEEGD